jgi:hypothetical protein
MHHREVHGCATCWMKSLWVPPDRRHVQRRKNDVIDMWMTLTRFNNLRYRSTHISRIKQKFRVALFLPPNMKRSYYILRTASFSHIPRPNVTLFVATSSDWTSSPYPLARILCRRPGEHNRLQGSTISVGAVYCTKHKGSWTR